jgi:hypothetical protein
VRAQLELPRRTCKLCSMVVRFIIDAALCRYATEFYEVALSPSSRALVCSSHTVKASVNKDRERVLRTGEPSCRTRIVDRAARAGARSLPLVRP